jgi:hypothetical protein
LTFINACDIFYTSILEVKMNNFSKICQMINILFYEMLTYTTNAYLKNILIPTIITLTLSIQYSNASEKIITSHSITNAPQKIKIEHYSDFRQRKAERTPFNRNPRLPVQNTYAANSGIDLDKLKPYIPEDFFKTNLNIRDIPDEAIYNPELKHDPIYKTMSRKMLPKSRLHSRVNYYAQYEDDPLPIRNISSDPSTSSASFNYTPTKEILLLTSLSNDWEDSYDYTTQMLHQHSYTTPRNLTQKSFSHSPSFVVIHHTQ